jgi:hypothetical protein
MSTPLHFVWDMNLHGPEFEADDGDSNEVATAKCLIRAFREKNGISDEMTYAEIDFVNELFPFIECAAEVLRARDLI